MRRADLAASPEQLASWFKLDYPSQLRPDKAGAEVSFRHEALRLSDAYGVVVEPLSFGTRLVDEVRFRLREAGLEVPEKTLPRWASWIVGALEAFSWLVYQVFRHIAPRDAEGRRVGKKILLTMIVVVMAMLAASLQGNKDAATTLAGCVAYDGIRFANPPEAIEQNRTYWLVLHQGDLYYVREPPGSSGGNYVIPESQDLGISRTRENPTRAC